MSFRIPVSVHLLSGSLLAALTACSADAINHPVLNETTATDFLPAEGEAIPAEIAPEPVLVFDRNNPQAKGIILAFHHWPNTQEEQIILHETAAAGLKKTKALSRFKVWLFEWPEYRTATTAQSVCSTLLDTQPDIASLEYCEPNYLLIPG